MPKIIKKTYQMSEVLLVLATPMKGRHQSSHYIDEALKGLKNE